MRIGEINLNNFLAYQKMFSKAGAGAPSLPMAQFANLPERKHTNPYAEPGMDITGRTDWKKIIPVSDEIREKVLSLTKREFLNNYGMSDGEEYSAMARAYIKGLPPEERAPAGWTIDQLRINKSQEYAAKIREHIPGWNYGDSFDPSFLEDKAPSENVLDRKV